MRQFCNIGAFDVAETVRFGLQVARAMPKKCCAAICSELNEHLAGVLPAEQTDKGFGSLLKPVFDGLTAFDGS